MKTPLIIIIAIVVSILGFLLIYSQQHDKQAMTTPAASGGYGAAPAAGGYGVAPSGGYR